MDIKIISFITDIGLKPEHTAIEKKKIKSFNVLTFSGAIINFSLGLFFFFNYPITSIFHFVMTLGYGLSLYTHIKLNYKTAISFYWVTNILYFILFSFIISKDNIGVYFSTMLMLVLLFLNNNWLRAIVSILIVIGFFLKLNYVEAFLYSHVNHPFNSAIGLFILIYYVLNAFKYSNGQYEIKLEKQYKEALETQKILDSQKQELKKLDELKSFFLINLSHEIRTPITLINGYTSKLDFDKPKEYNTAQINVINDQLYQMQTIVNTIMDLGKIDSNQLMLNKSVTSLHMILNNQFDKFKPVFDEKSIDFSIEIPKKDVFIYMDALQMERCIANLLSNTLKFTPKQGKVVLFVKHLHSIEIGVLDNGIGIPTEDINSVFNRFFQSKNHITRTQGSGIGLSYTKKIIDKHGFSIAVESNPNIETVFKIKVPENLIYKTITPKVKTKQTTIENLKNKNAHILIVDDHEQMRSYLKSLLPDNINIHEAENGLDAIEIIENKNIDLIITDYMMPVMDGEEFVKQLKKKQNKTPIIVLTARTDNQGKLSMLRLGIDGYLHKPFMEEELLINVRNSLKLHENIKEFDKNNSIKEVKELNKHIDKFHTQITTYINENIASNLLTLDNIADYMNISRSTLNRKTKSLLGQTVNQLIIEVRLAKARNLLLEDPLTSKKDIAKAVGLSSTTHLFNSLKERYGM